jgi:hypothetical protein
MKKILFVIMLVFLFFPTHVYANGAGLPQFFKINSRFPTVNPLQVYGITAQGFLLPQDIAPETYLVNEPINFAIDTKPLGTVIDEELLERTTFTWDFGDGSKAEGLENTHAYSKIGSYILLLTFNVYTDESQAPTQFIDSFLINIIPEKGFTKFPQAVIKVNDRLANTNPQYNLIHHKFSSPVFFDATKSKAIGSTITAYFWNFGDGETSTDAQAVHKYANKDFVAAVLRVKDSNGFISDAFVGLKNENTIENKEFLGVTLLDQLSTGILVVLGVFCIVIVIAIFLRRKR